ncbi:unnamed protein product, partial [Prorocentrum cordatum]
MWAKSASSEGVESSFEGADSGLFDLALGGGWEAVVGDLHGEVASALCGVVPLSEGPDQVARDGGEFAALVLSRSAAVAPGVPVRADCAGTSSCAERLGRGAWADERLAQRWSEI